jgi:hypothetical protein
MTDMTNIAQIAGQVATVDEAILKALPIISVMVGFIPGAQPLIPFMPLLGGLLTAVDTAAKDLASNNPDMAFEDIINAIKNHLTNGAPNSPTLSGPMNSVALPQAS